MSQIVTSPDVGRLWMTPTLLHNGGYGGVVTVPASWNWFRSLEWLGNRQTTAAGLFRHVSEEELEGRKNLKVDSK